MAGILSMSPAPDFVEVITWVKRIPYTILVLDLMLDTLERRTREPLHWKHMA